MARKRTPGPAAKPRAAKPVTGDTVFSLKITLNWVSPAVWRQIELPDCTLEDLHLVIQVCMPWGNSHLWEFSVGEQRFGMGMEDEFGDMYGDDENEPAFSVRLTDLVKTKVKTFRYTYDFGDSWEHTIALEKTAREPKAKYPRCVAGERACPPDDCGGAPGYENLLEILANRKHPEHKEMLQWAGGQIDPEAFDLNAINKALARVKLT
jgi:hypothetical protein